LAGPLAEPLADPQPAESQPAEPNPADPGAIASKPAPPGQTIQTVPPTRIALGIEYDGAPFEGWQTQAHRRTVQDVLEAALSQFAGEPLSTICAGRTDAGVHASGQVVHIDTAIRRAERSWVRGVNRYLPAQVAVCWAREVPPDFDARHAARMRHYEYWILNHPVRSPLLEHRTGWVFRALDVEAMQRAGTALLGTHDFSAFRSSQCQAASPVRTLTRCEVERIGAGPLVRVRTSANAFLHHMVRNLVGALVDVGTGRRPVEWVGQLLRARDRTLGPATIEAAGLYLTAVEYDPRFGLPSARAPGIFAQAAS
jgi:tRNA pseudouridine38-40 synthase